MSASSVALVKVPPKSIGRRSFPAAATSATHRSTKSDCAAAFEGRLPRTASAAGASFRGFPVRFSCDASSSSSPSSP